MDRPERRAEVSVAVSLHISSLRRWSEDIHLHDDDFRFRELSEEMELVSQLHKPNFNSLLAKLNQLLSAPVILSESFHGFLSVQAFGIPSMPIIDGLLLNRA